MDTFEHENADAGGRGANYSYRRRKRKTARIIRRRTIFTKYGTNIRIRVAKKEESGEIGLTAQFFIDIDADAWAWGEAPGISGAGFVTKKANPRIAGARLRAPPLGVHTCFESQQVADGAPVDNRPPGR